MPPVPKRSTFIDPDPFADFPSNSFKRHPSEELREASAVFAAHATELSERIDGFQQWLDRLPGKTCATCWREISGLHLGVRFVRYGDWELQSAWTAFPAPNTTDSPYSYMEANADWTRLSRCNVETKIAAIDLFPDLVDALANAAAARVNSLILATQKFDEFAKQYGLTEEEGK